MNKTEALDNLIIYLKSHNITYKKSKEEDSISLYLNFQANKSPGKIIESTIYFYESEMIARVYYSAMGSFWCSSSKYKNEVFKLFNYMNAMLFLQATDNAGNTLYKPNMLYTPRFFITEDGFCDITMTTVIAYDFYEVAPLETADYLTMFCPNVLNDLSMPIFWTIFGKTTAKEASHYIQTNIIKDDDLAHDLS